jgi:CBS domain-containing protein
MRNGDGVKLPIRARRTVRGNGDSSRTLVIYCPKAHGSRAFDVCAECERCDGITVDDADHRRYVLCRPEADLQRAPKRILPTAADLTSIAMVLAREVTCLVPALTLADAVRSLEARQLAAAPVVDGEDRPVGMITRVELLRAQLAPPGSAPTTVGDRMHPVACVLDENASLARAAALMASQSLPELVVVGDFGRVVGLLTALDVTRWLAQQAGFDV